MIQQSTNLHCYLTLNSNMSSVKELSVPHNIPRLPSHKTDNIRKKAVEVVSAVYIV